MKRLQYAALIVVSSIFATACTEKSGGSGGSPTAPTAPTVIDRNRPPFWEGVVKYSRHTVQGPLNETVMLEGSVIWEREDPEVGPLVDADEVNTYVLQSGSLTATHSGNIGSCTIAGAGLHKLQRGEGLMKVHKDGTYFGGLHSAATFPSTVACPGIGAAPLARDVAPIDLDFNGIVTDLRMVGSFDPFTVVASTFSGSWDFFAVLSNPR